MARKAPDKPAIQDLHAKYKLSSQQTGVIKQLRREIISTFSGGKQGFVAIIGPCAMTSDNKVITKEGAILAKLTAENKNLTALHRIPPWKPRTNPDDWHGLETDSSTVEQAYQILHKQSAKHANTAVEIGMPEHIDRYGELISFGWVGARNVDNFSLINKIIDTQPGLPIGVKNGLDGDISSSLKIIDMINNKRGVNGSTAILIYRGGENAKNPKDWEKQYLRAFKETNGRIIVDCAHGGEMAHHPDDSFQKSVAGQIACAGHLREIIQFCGKKPLGIMMEASDAASPTDPVIPFSDALELVRNINTSKSGIIGV